MLHSLTLLAQAAEQASPEALKPEGLAALFGNPLIMMVLFIVIFWVLLIRPQRKAQKEHQARLQALQTGDKVITNAGIHGIIEKISDTTVDVKVADNVILKLEKAAITVVNK